MIFPHHTHLNEIISHHSRSSDTLGPYWQPGRKVVEGLLDAVPFQITPSPPKRLSLAGSTFIPDRIEEPLLDQVEDTTWDPSSAVRLKIMDGKEWLMTKTFTMRSLEGYLRTWSALHAYHEAHPEDAARKGKGQTEGDIVDRLVRQVAEEMGKDAEEEFEAGWPLVLMMIKKKP